MTDTKTVNEIINLIRTLAGGTIFSVLFRKRSNGEYRRMVCRLDTTRKLRGGERTFDPIEKGLLTVFDMQKEDWRSIPLETIEWLHIRGQEYNFNQETVK